MTKLSELQKTELAKNLLLKQCYNVKIDMLERALKEKKFGVFLEMSRWLLDAPISEGGLPTETIEQVRLKYY